MFNNYLSSFSFLFIFLSSAIIFEISRLMASSLFTATYLQLTLHKILHWEMLGIQKTLCFNTNLVFL